MAYTLVDANDLAHDTPEHALGVELLADSLEASDVLFFFCQVGWLALALS